MSSVRWSEYVAIHSGWALSGHWMTSDDMPHVERNQGLGALDLFWADEIPSPPHSGP